MRKILLVAAIGVTLLSISDITQVLAQSQPPTLHEQINRAADKRLLPTHLRKIDSRLREFMQQIKNSGDVQMITRAEKHLFDVDRVHVELRVNEITSQILAQLAELDFAITTSTEHLNVSANQQMIVGWLTLAKIEELARLPAIFQIRLVDLPMSNIGFVTSAGDAIHRAPLVRSLAGIDGIGQTVGIISTGVDHLADAQSSGDVPDFINVINNRFGCIGRGTDCGCPDGDIGCDVKDEGTAMLEIVHDMVPGANLAFADFGSSRADFADNILRLAAVGSTVIVDDIGWFTSPIYEDGIIAQTVNNVVNTDDIVYVSAAGNQARTSYEANFFDLDGNRLHDFDTAGGNESLPITLRGERTLFACLHWNNRYGQARDDYDFFLFNAELNTILAASTNAQNGTGDPIECLVYENPTANVISLNLVVEKFAGAEREFTIVFSGFARGQDYVSPTGAVKGHHAAERCLAIGAIPANDPGNDDIASFSSHGPSRIYSYDANGNPVSFVDRDKPDLVAIDRVRITGAGQFGFQDPPNSGRWFFSGTSAAAPHVAAIAAMVRAANPSLSAVQVGQILKDSAVDLGSPNFDFIYGHGRTDVFAAVSLACPSCIMTTGAGGFINLSTNTVAPLEGIAAGFIVTGNQAKQFAILGENISGMDPLLSLEDGAGNIITRNDNWQSHSSAALIEPILGRTPNNPTDAGFVVTLAPNSAYIARLSDVLGRTNVRGIVSINDAEGFINSIASGTLINISTNAGVPANGMAAGFIVRGTVEKQYVILGENISGMNPVLRLEDSFGNILASNDNWQSHSSAELIEPILGRTPNNLTDAGFVVTLVPDATYIVWLSDATGRTDVRGIVSINDGDGFLLLP